MVKRIIILLFLVSIHPSFIIAIDDDVCVCDPRLMEVNKKNYFSELTPSAELNPAAVLSDYQKNSLESSRYFLSKYRQSEQAARVGTAIVEANKLKWDVVMATVPVKNPLVDVGLKYANEKVHDILKDAIEKDRKHVFKQLLLDVRNNHEADYKKIIKPDALVDKETMKGVLENSTVYKAIEKELVDTGKASDVDLLILDMTQQLRSDITSVNDQSYLRDVVIDSKVNNIGKRVVNLTRQYESFVKEQTNLNSQLIQQGKDISESLEKITGTLNKHSSDLTFLKGIAYEQLSPAEKYEAVKNDLVSVKNKETTLQELERQARVDKYMKTSAKILNDAGAIVSIMSNVGVDPEFVNKASNVVQAGSLLFEGVSAFLSDNPLQAMASLTGIFKIGGTSPQEAQMKQMQKTLNAIYGLNVEMDKKLDELLKQTRVTQELIVKSTESLHNAVANNQKIVLQKLNEIHAEVRLTQSLIHQYEVGNPIATYWSLLKGHRNLMDYDAIPHYYEFKYAFEGFGISTLLEVRKALNASFLATDGFNQQRIKVNDLFRYKAVVTSEAHIDFQTLVSSLKLMLDDKKASGFYSLALPVMRFKDISIKSASDYSAINPDAVTGKVNSSFLYEIAEAEKDPSDYIASHSQIDPRAIVMYSSTLLSFVQMTNYLKTDGYQYQFASIDEVKTLSKGVSDSYFDLYDELWTAYYLTNLAIAQQNLFSGDILLDYYADLVLNKSIFEDSKALHLSKLKLLLENNDIFRRNFTNVLFATALKRSSGQALSYKHFINKRDTISMRKLLSIDNGYNDPGNKIYTSLKKDGFKWGFDKNTPYSFPEGGEIDMGIIEYPNAIESLYTLSEKLFQQILYMQSLLPLSKFESPKKFKDYELLLKNSQLPKEYFKTYQKTLLIQN